MWRFVRQENGTQKSEIAKLLKLPCGNDCFLSANMNF